MDSFRPPFQFSEKLSCSKRWSGPHLQDCIFPFNGARAYERSSSAMGLVFTLISNTPKFLARPGLVHRTRHSSIDGFSWTQTDAFWCM
jgi:hypothetical protein